MSAWTSAGSGSPGGGRARTDASPVLVSACLAGRRCRYDGTDRRDERIVRMVDEGEAVPFCPEESVGLPVPRPPCEIAGGDGADVLAGRARVVQSGGADITELFVKGAHKAVAAAQKSGATRAILKTNSPSCGTGRIYDGTFSGTLRPGMGVTAALLDRDGLVVEGCSAESD